MRTAPVTSSVSVVRPSRSVAIYRFSPAITYSDAFTARPIRIGSTPVASGSSVPVCPTCVVWYSRRQIEMIRCDVTPACLFTMRIPDTAEGLDLDIGESPI